MSDITISYINTPEKFGLALKRLRKASGLSQSALAGKMKMRQPTLSDIENGRGTLESVFKIIQALQINLIAANTDVNSSQELSKESPAKKLLNLLKEIEGK